MGLLEYKIDELIEQLEGPVLTGRSLDAIVRLLEAARDLPMKLVGPSAEEAEEIFLKAIDGEG